MADAPKYPKRPPYFAHRFTRLMGKVCLGARIGPDTCWLLAYIAHTEDAAGWRRPVTFFNEDLATRLGMSVSAMRRARTRAVEAGWLVYIEGAKRRAPQYFVNVPENERGHADGAGDEFGDDWDVSTGEDIPRQIDAATDREAADNRQGTDRQGAGKRQASEQPSSLPLPLPQESSNRHSDAGESVIQFPTEAAPTPSEVRETWNTQVELTPCQSSNVIRDRFIRTWATTNGDWVKHWRAVVEFMGRTPKYNGGTKLRWRATLDWVFEDSNFSKVCDEMLASRPKPFVPVIHRADDMPGLNVPKAPSWDELNRPNANGDAA